MTARERAEALAGKWGVYTESLDGDHLVLALEEAARYAEAEVCERAALLIDKRWETVKHSGAVGIERDAMLCALDWAAKAVRALAPKEQR